MTKFLKLHPGGKKILLGVGGQECSEQFNQFHNAAAVLAKYGPKLQVGEIEGGAASKKAPAAAAAAPAAAAPAAAAPKKAAAPASTALVSIPSSVSSEPFGEQIPYGAQTKTPSKRNSRQHFCEKCDSPLPLCLFGPSPVAGDPAWYQGSNSPYYNGKENCIRNTGPGRHWLQSAA